MRDRSALPWRLRTPARTIATGLVVNLVAVVACLAGHAAHAASAPEPAPPLRPIEAPHYGDVLFRFYQDQTLGALTTLMVSQHFQRLGQHDDEAEVLRGGLMLAYGMHREAGEVFSRLIERNTAPGVRNRAWFYLAQVRFARGLAEPARDALARIDGPLQPVLEDERQLLQAQVQLALNDPAGAAKALEALATAPGRSATETVATAQAAARSAYNPPPEVTRSWFSRVQDWLLQPFRGSDAQVRTQADAQLFARFNLGVALIRGGDAAGGQRWLDELGQMPAANEEQRTLRDRANLALGFGALQRNEPEAARKWLERIRLEGPVSNKALLGFGWAAMALKQPQQALLPWRALVARDDTDAAVMEARIALPFALAELGAEAEALTGYRSALTGFDEEAGRIEASMASLRTGNWLADLLERDAAAEMRWRDPLARVGQLPSLAHGRQLAPVLASHDFQEGFKTWRDLRFLQQNLRDWQAQLSSFSDMLAQRQARFAERLPEVRGEADRRNLAPLQQRLASLQAELTRAEAAADGLAFATDSQQALLQRVTRGLAALSEPALPLAEPERQAAAERLRLASGLLQWELAQTYPERRWPARQALVQSDSGLTQASASLAALARAQAEQALNFQRFDQRIRALTERIAKLLPELAQQEAAQASQLQALALSGLSQQQERLSGYRTQARFAMAQLLDSARLPPKEMPQDTAQEASR